MKISKDTISENSPVYIIAEAGVNHNGDIEIAKKLIDVASHAGANAVKFQTFIPELLSSVHAEKAEYQKKYDPDNNNQIEMLNKLSLPFEDYYTLLDYAKDHNITFLSSPFDEKSLELLVELEVDAIKIPSGELTNLWLLDEINKYGKPAILSTGMSIPDEIEIALSHLKDINVALLHCVSSYPTPYNEVNLRAIHTLKEQFRIPVGFSDHTNGIEISLAAVSLGANIIEKHFTLDKNMVGPDHKSSINPNELNLMISSIRNIEECFGDGIKRVQPCEENVKAVARKSIVAKYDIKEGEKISRNNLTAKRPGTGIPILNFNQIDGKIALRTIKKDELITKEMII
ncbi:MAG: N-acetylneuraminate synthase [Candidatus Heimdallarchaeota archaeon]|nr:N-acetylneuraminate synthase [Candidatus Heimdallarchaeota archaeon]MDH5645511.1 N-acetylneuraminate synthase [Candidatus Heimdallarchaeota archaeon]